VITAATFHGCKAQAPASKSSNTQDLLTQIESIEADEATLLFQQAKAAAKEDDPEEARSLIKQALGRGAGSSGLAEAEMEIKKAEARITDRKRKAQETKRAREATATQSSGGNSYSPTEGNQQVRSIIVTAEANKYGRNIDNFSLSRSGGVFGELAGSSVSIGRPYSGTIGGDYSFSLSFKFKPQPFSDYQQRSCNGNIPVSGYKQYVRVTVYEDCRIEIYEN